MYLHILGGNSISNKERSYSLSHTLHDTVFSETHAQEYDHRNSTEAKEINIDIEAKKLYETIQEKSEYTIVAKSAGTLVTLHAMKLYKLNPAKIIFIGFPVSFATNALGWNIQKILTAITYDKPFYLIQQSNDPAGTPQEVSTIFSQAGKKIIGGFYEGNSHFYKVETIKNYITIL